MTFNRRDLIKVASARGIAGGHGFSALQAAHRREHERGGISIVHGEFAGPNATFRRTPGKVTVIVGGSRPDRVLEVHRPILSRLFPGFDHMLVKGSLPEGPIWAREEE